MNNGYMQIEKFLPLLRGVNSNWHLFPPYNLGKNYIYMYKEEEGRRRGKNFADFVRISS